MASTKQIKQLTVMLIILAVIAVIFFGITAFNRYQENHAEDDTISISTIENISKISFDNGTDNLSFMLDENDYWYYADDADFPLQSSYVESIADAVEGLTAERVISPEESDSLSAYGLESPQATITVSNDSGETAQILLGNSNSNGYYLKLSDSDTIYTIDAQLMDSISHSLYDFAEIEDIPAFDVGKLTSIQINDTVITVKTEETTVENEDGETTTQNTTTWYYGETDISEYSQINSLSYNIPYLSFSALAAWQPTAEQLQELGLAQPITVTFNYAQEDGTESTYTLLIGKQASDSQYYVMQPNSDRIYLISTTDVTALVSIATDGLSADINLDDDTEYNYGEDYGEWE